MRLQSSIYEKLIYIKRYFNLFIEKKLFNFYTNIVGTIPLKMKKKLITLMRSELTSLYTSS